VSGDGAEPAREEEKIGLHEGPAGATDSSSKTSRRKFIRAVLVVGAFVALGGYVLSRYLLLRGPTTVTYPRQMLLVDDLDRFGDAAGKPINVGDLTTFPPNSNWVITYPSTGDPKADAQLPDTFRKFELIRLPVELGGEKLEAGSFVAFSKVCVHLECSPNYVPLQNTNPGENGYEVGPGYTTHQQFECPCHGTTYRIPDGLAVEGPASVQPPPTNAVPMLTLSADDQGYLWAEPPVWDVYHNGKLGYGRYVQS
jgi:Rieske Fe-S protein